MNESQQNTTNESPVKRIIITVLIVIFVSVLVFLTVKLIKIYTPPKSQTDDYRSETQSSVISAPVTENPVNFEELQKRNPDVCGWIHIPGTEEAYGIPIDYPIFQSGEDKEEDFYLKHDIDGKPLFDGSIYIQKINSKDFTDPNTLIYGHDLYNKCMFTPLRKYRNQDFFNRNQYIYIYIPGHILKYHIYATSLFNDRHVLYTYNFNKKEDYEKFLAQTLDTSQRALLVRQGVNVTTDDKIITLSTCTNRKHERLLVTAVLIEDTATR